MRNVPARKVTGDPRGLVPQVGFVASALTAFCCLGLSVAVSLASSIGATFLTHDTTLRPLLAIALGITVAGTVWTYRHHRSLPPLILTVAAAALVYAALYGPLSGVGGTHATGSRAGHQDAMHDTMTGTATSHSGGSANVLVWIGLGLLLAAQLWDIRRLRTCAVATPLPASTSAA